MRKLTAFLSVSLLILTFPLNTFSGDKQQFCNSYADTAVSQYKLGKQHNLPGIVPPAWSNDRNAHFMWCMMVAENLANSETSKRQAYLDQSIQKQAPASPVTAGKIEKAELVSLDGNVMHVRFQYSVGGAITGEMYGGAFLYDVNLKAINAGYKPTRPYSTPRGSMDIYLNLPAEPFQAATLETFILHSGKVLVKQYFKSPFVWDGAQGGIVNPSVIKNGQGSAQNAQMVVKPMQTMPSVADIKQLNPQVKTIKPGGIPIGLDPGRGP